MTMLSIAYMTISFLKSYMIYFELFLNCNLEGPTQNLNNIIGTILSNIGIYKHITNPFLEKILVIIFNCK